MADRIFKGKLAVELSEAFDESAETFDTPHAGGLVPFDVIQEVLGIPDRDLVRPEGDATFELVNGSIWLTREDIWIKIDPDGTIEIGLSGG